jgi:hypothetical protein
MFNVIAIRYLMCLPRRRPDFFHVESPSMGFADLERQASPARESVFGIIIPQIGPPSVPHSRIFAAFGCLKDGFHDEFPRPPHILTTHQTFRMGVTSDVNTPQEAR